MKQESLKLASNGLPPAEPRDVVSRLKELSTLQQGWLNGKGHALSKDRLLQLGQLFEASFDIALPLPFLYPTAEGGVQAEWSMGDWSVSLEIDLVTFKSEYQALNLKNNFCDERSLDLSVPNGWTQLNMALKQLEPGTRGVRSIAS
jgi:hypothetical protein